jgi:hypothetical protein
MNADIPTMRVDIRLNMVVPPDYVELIRMRGDAWPAAHDRRSRRIDGCPTSADHTQIALLETVCLFDLSIADALKANAGRSTEPYAIRA